jgi:hypothetical protein
LAFIAVLLGVVFLSSSVEAQKKDIKGKATEDKKPTPVPLPPNSVLAVFDRAADALKAMPNAILLSPEKYKELVEELARLRAQLEKKKTPPALPSKLLLKGKVEGGLVVLQAQYEFVTARAQTVVSLGCGQGHATGASLAGRTPHLLGGGRPAGGDPEGFSVQVESAGKHELTLDLVVPLTARTGGHGFILDLPRAAITRLELELPAGVKDIQVGNKPMADTLLSMKGTLLAGSLGAADKLDLAWQGAHAAAGSGALAADGLIQVRLDPRGAHTTAKLTLKPLGGQVDRWRLVVPANAEVKTLAADEGRVGKIDLAKVNLTAPRAITIYLKESSAQPITFSITVANPLPKAGGRTPVGPFFVLGAARQTGSILVSSAAVDLQLGFFPQGHLSRRDVSEEEQRRDSNLIAAYRYGQSTGSKPAGDKLGPSPAPLLEIEAETVHGQIKARVAHTLTRSARDSGAASQRWQVATVITATPRWSDVDRLQVQLPPGAELLEEGALPSGDRVRQVTLDRNKRIAEFRLARGSADAALKPFTVTLETIYSALEGNGLTGNATLILPRPLGAVAEGGEVTVRGPSNSELIAPEGANANFELLKQSTHEFVWRSKRRAPDRIQIAWRPWRPEVHSKSLIDITFAGDTATIRQEISLRFSQPAPGQVVLRVPPGIDRFRVLEGGRLVGGESEARAARTIALTPPANTSVRLVLDYAVSLEWRGEVVEAPFLVPEKVTQGETKVRLWAVPGTALHRIGSDWIERDLEEVPGQDRLPSLVIQSGSIDRPLKVRRSETQASVVVLADRCLVQVEMDAGGVQNYRVRYRLRRLAAREVDVRLPVPVSALEFRARLNDKTVAWQPVDETGAQSDGGRIARLRLSPVRVGQHAILELTYQLAAGRTDVGPFWTGMQPAALQSSVPTRWQVNLPPGMVALGPESGPGSAWTWARRGWLFAPRPVVTEGDLERWLHGNEEWEPGEDSEMAGAPTLVCWRDGPETVLVTHVSQQAWLLACSLALLLAGLVVSCFNWSAPWLWLMLGLCALAILAAGLLWPTVVGQIAYGCQPGAAVLVLVVGMQLIMHERKRRQVVFLPSFSRSRSAPSLGRKEPAAAAPARPTAQPSTVDGPRPVGSSVERGAPK